jgi:rare lipoprotein A (peptidoglycan hydrolase)
MGRTRRLGLRWFVFANLVLPAVAIASAHAAPKRHSKATSPFRQLTHASWYGADFRGRRMAGGKQFNPRKLTAAHRTLHIGSQVKVTDVRTGRSVVVQITDRGPYWPGRGIDLSYAAARELGIVRRGVAQVRVELVTRDERPAGAPIVTAMSGPPLAWLPTAIVE